MYRLAGGRVVEKRGEEDALGLMRQLGVKADAQSTAFIEASSVRG